MFEKAFLTLGSDSAGGSSSRYASGATVRIARCMVAATSLAVCVMMNAAAAPMPVELEAAVKAYDAAQITGDRAALTRLLAEDYLLVNGAGALENKKQFVAESTDPAFKLDPFVVLHPANRVWLDGAVVAGEVYLTGRSDGKGFKAHIRFADVWAQRSGRWQVVFTQVTRMPNTETDNK
jgi:ketosteroid isomerase-like protein